MISLITTIAIGLLLMRWLFPKGERLQLQQPAPSITIHVHGPILVNSRAPCPAGSADSVAAGHLYQPQR
jgi:hypothetical protein